MSSDESVLKVVPSYVPGEAAKTLGEVKLVPSGKKSGSNLRVPRTDGNNVEQMLAETIIQVTHAASNNKRMKHSSHHADEDEPSANVEDMEIVPGAFPDDKEAGPTSVVSSNEVDTPLNINSSLEENIGVDSPLSTLDSIDLSSIVEE